MIQVGTDAVLAKPLPKLRRGSWKRVSSAIVADAPLDEPSVTVRWPGWASVAIAAGVSGLGWFAIIGLALWVINRH